MDYSKVTVLEYQAKKKAILDSLGRTEGNCISVHCYKCPFTVLGDCKLDNGAEMENPLEAIKIVMDYEIPVDWGKVEVDTPILVKDDKRDEWVKRHFAKYENSLVWAFNNGFTSWTGKENNVNNWEYARLAEAESEEINNEK